MAQLTLNLRKATLRALPVVCIAAVFCFGATAQQGKDSAKTVAGHYEGTAKSASNEEITVSFDLTEKDGALSGMIRSSHGDFTITGGSHKGEDVTLEFATDGPTGTITLKLVEDKLSGTWSAGDDGGAVEVKKVSAPAKEDKSKSS